MALPNPICIYTYELIDGSTSLTYFKTTWNGSAWSTPPFKVFDSGVPATFTYSQTAGATVDGTHVGLMLSHSIAGVGGDVTTLEFLADGLPATPIDVSASNTLSASTSGLPSGAFWLNGAYYGIFQDFNGGLPTSAVRVMTSVTGSAPWTELDAAHHPLLTSNLPNRGALRVNLTAKKIDIFATTGTGFFCHIFLYTFDLVTFTWSTQYANLTINMGVGGSIVVPLSSFGFGESVVRFPNGDIGVIYERVPSGFAGPWVFRIWNGVVWSAEITLPLMPQSGLGYGQTIIDPASPETMNVWAHNGNFGHTDTFTYFTVTHAGVVSGALYTTRTVNIFSAGGMGHGIASAGIQYVPITDPDKAYESVWIGTSGTSSFTETQLPIPAIDVGVTPNVAGYMLDIQAPPPFPVLVCPFGGGTATIGVPYSATLFASGGTPPYTFFIVAGGLPPGISLNSATGVISGTPLTSGTFTYTAEVIDANGLSAQVTCSITIPSIPATPLGLLCPTTTTVLQGQSYSFPVIVIDGTAPFTFALISGALPPGLTLNTSTGVISGTATASGTYTYQIQVTDANGNVSTTTCVLTSSQCPGAL